MKIVNIEIDNAFSALCAANSSGELTSQTDITIKIRIPYNPAFRIDGQCGAINVQ